MAQIRLAADVVLLHGCPQSGMPNPLEGLLEVCEEAYGMEISAEKTKLMTSNTSGINTEIKVNGQKLETVTSFKYLGSVVTDEGPKPEILSRIAQTTAALPRLKPVWNDRNVSLSSKIQLMCSLVTSCSAVIQGFLFFSDNVCQGSHWLFPSMLC